LKKMLVGVTGSPGCGKSTVSEIFRESGARIIDVDEAGRWVVDHVPAIRRNLRGEFSKDVFTASGELDRRKLGSIVFADKKKLLKLNQIVHPDMINRVRQLILNAQNKKYSLPYIIVDAALIFELYLHTELDYIITVSAPYPVRIKRLCDRHGITEKAAEQITESQLAQEEKIQRANFVIENTDTINTLKDKVHMLHHSFIQKAKILTE